MVLNEARVLELLNFPIHERCVEFAFLFEEPTMSIKNLQDIFVAVVHSVFGVNTGGVGWGLRTFVSNHQPAISQTLFQFFCSNGPMIRCCYRLINERVSNEPVKFEFNLDKLPKKLAMDLQTGHYSQFYSDLVNVDPFRRQITSLSLNAFEYYMLHFLMHVTVPLHKQYSIPLQVHNDRLKTVYYHLCGHYLKVFLTNDPDSIVLPLVSGNVKAPPQIPVQTLPPKRSPKYLKIPNVQNSLYGDESPSSIDPAIGTSTITLTNEWRTECLLNFFVDCWLRFEIDESRDLPSSEFIRCVRCLVQQMHNFGNSAKLDQTAMVSLRKSAQPMMKACIFPFLKSVLDRWPIDSSLCVVLDLWLSYLQPWRYVYRPQSNPNAYQIPEHLQPNSNVIENLDNFDGFILDNLYIYTQLFIYILPRLERLDYSSLRNINVLQRIVKLFFWSPLHEKLIRAETFHINNAATAYDTPQKRATSAYLRHHTHDTRYDSGHWDKSQYYHNDMYTPLFSASTQNDIAHFVKTIHAAEECIRHEVLNLICEREKYFQQNRLLKLLSHIYNFKWPQDAKLQDMQRMPCVLSSIIQGLCRAFYLPIPECPNAFDNGMQPSENHMPNLNYSLDSSSSSENLLNISKQALQMHRRNLPASLPQVDPALVPIQSNECAMLVRFLHQCSCKLNEMLQTELPSLYERADVWGRLAREVLYPPMTVQWFDKPSGVNELCEQQLPARIILRPLASYGILFLLIVSLIFGQIFFHAPSYGLLTLTGFFIGYIFIRSLFQ